MSHMSNDNSNNDKIREKTTTTTAESSFAQFYLCFFPPFALQINYADHIQTQTLH